MKQSESGFKRTINWNKYQSKLKEHPKNTYLDYLTDPSFQGVNRLSFFIVWSIGDKDYLPKR